MAIIKVKNISKTYNENTVPVHALRGVDLEIEQGEFTAVAAMIRYVLYDGLDAMSAMKLIDMGVSVKPSNIDWYKRSILKLSQEQRDEIQEAQDGNIPTVRPQSL